MSHEYEYAVFIGRFQPFHNGHLEIVEAALKKADKLIVVVGSSRSGRTIKNPFTFQERVTMIKAGLPAGTDPSRVEFVATRDYFYNDQLWLSELHQKVRTITGDSDSIALVGQYSDKSSYYLNMFPQWRFIPVHTEHRVHATEIRSALFEKQDFSKHVPVQVLSVLQSFCSELYGPHFANLVEEYDYTKRYKESWANAPYVPTFVTTDAVVVQSGHVLLVRRRVNPGKGKWALPGGFIRPDETILDSALRELYEETKLLVPKEVTRSSVVGEPKVFDYPGRSLRGRTITHAICVKLKDNYQLPQCKGSDDAEKATWIPIGDLHLMEEQFFEDHLSIIEAMLTRVK